MKIEPGTLVSPWKIKTLLLKEGGNTWLSGGTPCLVLDGDFFKNGRFYLKVLTDGRVGWLRDVDVEVIR